MLYENEGSYEGISGARMHWIRKAGGFMDTWQVNGEDLFGNGGMREGKTHQKKSERRAGLVGRCEETTGRPTLR